jgi:hypothetical protein
MRLAMADKLVVASLLLAALVHLPPLIGLLGSERLATLYGVSLDDPNLIVLLRHRAVLFGLLGGFQVVAVFRPELRGLAVVAGIASMTAFIALAWSTAGLNDALRRVALVDVGPLVLLLLAGARLAFR